MWLTAEEIDHLPDGAEVLVLWAGGVQDIYTYPSTKLGMPMTDRPPHAAQLTRLYFHPVGASKSDNRVAHVGPRRIPPVGLLEWMKIGSLGVTSLTLALAAMETQRTVLQGIANLGITKIENTDVFFPGDGPRTAGSIGCTYWDEESFPHFTTVAKAIEMGVGPVMMLQDDAELLGWMAGAKPLGPSAGGSQCVEVDLAKL